MVDNAASSFLTDDIFLTESYQNGMWYRDQGIAVYQGPKYATQLINFVNETAATVLSFPDYLTPYSTEIFKCIPISARSTPNVVEMALTALPNIDAVDVSQFTDSNGYSIFSVRFIMNLGITPLLISSNSGIVVSELLAGVSEIQTVTLASDIDYTRARQLFEVLTANTISISFNGTQPLIIVNQTYAAVQAALNSRTGPYGQPLNILVEAVPGSVPYKTAYTVTFISPVGPVPLLVVRDLTKSAAVDVVSVSQGASPSVGTFTLFYEGQFTKDIPHDASALEVKIALENLSTIGLVQVDQADTGNGYSWSVGFASNGGDLRLMEASPYRYEVQHISTTGGSPTPLHGQILIAFGGDSVNVNYDASASVMQSALESMPSVGDVEVSLQAYGAGQRTWSVTFRSLIGDVAMLFVDAGLLFGSNAAVSVVEKVQGSSSTLVGANPRLSVEKKVSGLPSYLASYTVDIPGNYLTRVSQLTSGGLYGQYFDNQYLYGTPVLERIDPTISFDFSEGLITPDAAEYVSVRWTGKLLAPKSEAYTLYLTADDFANLAVNHTLVINSSDVCCIEHRAVVYLVKGTYLDLVLEFQQLTGPASVLLQWSSASVRKQVIPSSSLFYAIDIVGSPFPTRVVPGAADYPYSDAYGDGLTSAIAGNIATFFIQTKDALGNNQITEYELVDPNEILSVTLKQDQGTEYHASLEYVGSGLFKATYIPLKSGPYEVSIKMGGYDIYCGRGVMNSCSPFSLAVSPGPTVATVSEAESPSSELSDYLVEGVAGQFGYIYLQAKDAFGNNRVEGGDHFMISFILLADSTHQYAGTIDDNEDGTYTVRYTIPTAGSYEVLITLITERGIGERIQTCRAAHSPYVYSRVYTGLSVYTAPTFCSLSSASPLVIVHNDLDVSSCSYDEISATSLTFATVGIPNTFHVDSRDAFGNLRTGSGTAHFAGYGDGLSDYFVADFEQAETGDVVRVSSAVDYIVASEVSHSTIAMNQSEYFRLSFAGRVTNDILSGVSAVGLQAILETLFDYQLNVTVTKSFTGHSSNSTTFTWAVQFLTMLDVWPRQPDSDINTAYLKIIRPSSSSASLIFFNSMSIERMTQKGTYPITFTLWHTGSYSVRVRNRGIDIQGSPLTISVVNGPLAANSSVAYGSGLQGGVAGQALSVNIQTKDTRQTAIQYLVASADISLYVSEIQQVINHRLFPFAFFFRGQTSVPMTVNSTYADLYSAFNNMTVLGNYSLFTTTGSPVLSTAFLGDFRVSFYDLVGTVPLLATVDSQGFSSSTTVSRVQVGDAPYRHAVQTIQCDTLTEPVYFTIGDVTVGPFNASTPISGTQSLASEFEHFGYGTVSIVGLASLLGTMSTGSYATHTLCNSEIPSVLYVTFTSFKGDLPGITSSSLSVAVSTSSTNGALSGIFPLWGSFSVGINGEHTPSMPLDIDAAYLQNALQRFYTLQNVTVTKDGYTVSYGIDGITPFFSTDQYVYSIYTISYRTICSDSTGIIRTAVCLDYFGDEALLSVDTSNILYSPSPYVNQKVPTLIAIKSRKGYSGNERLNVSDLSALALSLTPRNGPVSIGMSSTQRLVCSSLNTATGHFTLQILNDSYVVRSYFGASEMENVLAGNGNNSYRAVITMDPKGTGTVCSPTSSSSSSSSSTITFIQPHGHAFPLVQVRDVVNVEVAVYPIVNSLDSSRSLNSTFGTYELQYTPTIAGIYDLFITLNSEAISNNLGAGVLVLPAGEYAATSTHNISQVNVEGVREYFSVQLRDIFGNSLIGPMDPSSSFSVTMKGVPHQCQSDHQGDVVTAEIPVEVLLVEPYTDGKYTLYYDPVIAGSYEMHVRLITKGGLLATYYKTIALSQPVLASVGNFHDGLYHYPYWCDGEQEGNFSTTWNFGSVTFCDKTINSCGCDSTRLDSSLSFSWGNLSPLPFDDLYSGKFPSEYFSVQWVGYITAPLKGLYTFTLTSDYGVSMTINGLVMVDQSPMSSASVSFSVGLLAGVLNPIIITYYHSRDAAYFSAMWSGPGLIDNTVLAGDYLSFERDIIGSPLTVEVYPGAVAHTTSSASGVSLADCSALQTCSFTVQARDAGGNNIFNNGAISWNISIARMSMPTIYDDSYIEYSVSETFVQPLNVSIVPYIDTWNLVGTANVTTGGNFITVGGDVTKKVSRGDTILVVTETMMVSTAAVYDFNGASTKVPLSRPYLGKSSSSFQVYKIHNCTTGKYTVSYKPDVSGYYSINVSTQNVNEVQQVEFLSTGNLRGNYTLTVTSEVNGLLVTETSSSLQLGSLASSKADIEKALTLTLLGRVAVDIIKCDTLTCIYTVTFFGLDSNANLPLMTVYDSNISGNELQVIVKELTAGSSMRSIIGSPFSLQVSPGITSAPQTTAFGRGLTYGEPGVPSLFEVQSKDSYGNNRLNTQPRDIYRVHAFLPQINFDLLQSSVEGIVTYASSDQPQGWIDRVGDSCAVYSGLPDARRGECTSGSNCGCGSSDNLKYAPYSGVSAGLSADQACCACRSDCGGLYDVSFLPTLSGRYTVAILLGTQLEVQNITADISSRTGYFTLQYGLCEIGVVCAQTKPLSWNTDGAGMTNALMALAGIGPISVAYTTTSDRKTASWAVTFLSACAMNQITISGGNIAVMGVDTVRGVCAMVSAERPENITDNSDVHTYLVTEVQQVSLVCSQNCTYALSFRGYLTTPLSFRVSEAEIKAALEALQTIGTVSVVILPSDSPSIRTYKLSYLPTHGSTLGHIENYGDLPAIQVFSQTLDTSSVITLTNGKSPFTANVVAVVVNAITTTAVDQLFVPGETGLHTGIYLDSTSFTIESRDAFSNRVFSGPVKDVQIVETVGGSSLTLPLTGSFTLTFDSYSVEVSAQASIADMRIALESLPSVGAVDVSTNGATIPTELTATVTYGANVITSVSLPSSVFNVSDWIRLGSVTGPVYSVAALGTDSISLSGGYSGPTALTVPLYRNSPDGYQYIVRFDSNLGDLPAITVDASNLYEGDQPSHAYVTSCDQYLNQLIRTSGSSSLSGTFTLQMGSEITSHLAFDVSAHDMEKALELLSDIYTVSVLRSKLSSIGTYSWLVTFVSYDEHPTGLNADSHLLQGVDASIDVDSSYCPSTSRSGLTQVSSYGVVGETFLAILTGQTESKANITYLEQGLYSASYITPRLGLYNLTVSKADRGGLTGVYFNNRWLYGTPSSTRVDPVLDFQWGSDDMLTATGKDYISIRWTGYLLPAFSQVFLFSITVNDGARLWIDDELLIDEYENEISEGESPAVFTALTTKSLIANQLVSVRVEYRENAGAAAFSLAWSSYSQPYQIIPSYRLFPSVREISGSPFIISPSGRKPSVVKSVSLSVAAFDQLLCQFSAPLEDGGSSIVTYTVEWYSASVVTTSDVQSIKLSTRDVTGGTFSLLSPSGLVYPYGVPYDVTALELREILERLPDIGQVSVTRTMYSSLDMLGASDTGYMWSIKFTSSVAVVRSLMLGTTGLISTGISAVVCQGGSPSDATDITPACLATDSVLGSNYPIVHSSGAANTSAVVVSVGSVGYYSYLIKGLNQPSSDLSGFGVRVSATNIEGYSSVPSDALFLKPMGLPDGPKKVEVLRVTGRDDSLVVYYSAVVYPADRGSLVTHYTVRYSTNVTFYEAAEDLVPLSSVSFRGLDAKSRQIYSHIISGLTPGSYYYVDVSAANSVGTGPGSVATFYETASMMVQPQMAPDSISYGSVQLSTIPASTFVSVLESSTSLRVSFSAPKDTHGSAVSSYLVEWWYSAPSNLEVETITVLGGVSGSFRLAYNGSSTGYLSLLSSADTIRVALQSLPYIRGIRVSSSSSSNATATRYSWSVTFLDDYPSVFNQQITIDISGLNTGNSISTVSGTVSVYPLSTLPHGYDSAVVTAADGVNSYTYIIEGLQAGVSYYVSISSRNSEGYSVAQQSVPQQLAPPVQKPSHPVDVYMVSYSSSALSVLFLAGQSDGGAAVVKYKIEWDVTPSFDSNQGGPFGSYHKAVAANQNCSLYHCSYVIAGLQKGIPYYSRVFSYNALGYSHIAGIPIGLFESPKTQPSTPSSILLEAVSPNSIAVIISPCSDNGGAPVSEYRIEWDVLDSAAYESSTHPTSSLLYSEYEVQSISSSGSAEGLKGYFYIAFDGLVSDMVSVHATAEDMSLALEAIPTVGRVQVTRQEQLELFGYKWTVTFLNSEWFSGAGRYYDMPLLQLSGVDGTHASAFDSSISTDTQSSTFTGIDGAITVTQLVVAMSGYEQQSTEIRASSGVLSGTYSISTGGYSTVKLNVSAGPQEISDTLQAILSGTILVRRQNMMYGSGFTLFFIFTERLGGNSILVVDTTYLVSTDGSATVSATPRARVPGTLPILGSMYYDSAIVNVTDEHSDVFYQIPNLQEGLHYFVRVSAFNGAGDTYGPTLNGYPVLIQASKSPAVVEYVTLTAVSDADIGISWKDPIDYGGSAITSYLLELDQASSVKDVQVVSINSSSALLSGTFSLSFMGFATSSIPYDASASRMEAAIESLASVGNVQVTRTKSQGGVNSFSIIWSVTFLDNVSPIGMFSFSSTNIVGSAVTTGVYRAVRGASPSFSGGSDGVSRRPLRTATLQNTPSVQMITVNAFSSDLNGYFNIICSGETSLPIEVYSTADEMKAVLEGMFTVGRVDVTLSYLTLRTTGLQSNYGSSWTVIFHSVMQRPLLVSTGASQGRITAAGGSLSGSSAMVAVECVSPNEIVPTSYIFMNTTIGQQYVARVTAKNKYFHSRPIVSPIASAPAVSAPSVPLRVYMTVLSDSQISVYWDRPNHDGGAEITGYSIDWDVTLDFGSKSYSQFLPVTGDSNSTSYLISGLTSGLSYAVRVAAYNSQGYSPFVLALPRVSNLEVQVVIVSLSETFMLVFDDGYTTESTQILESSATASDVQSALQSLQSVRAVLVLRGDQSNSNSKPYRISYRITFLDAGLPSNDFNMNQLTSPSSDRTSTRLNSSHRR